MQMKAHMADLVVLTSRKRWCYFARSFGQ